MWRLSFGLGLIPVTGMLIYRLFFLQESKVWVRKHKGAEVRSPPRFGCQVFRVEGLGEGGHQSAATGQRALSNDHSVPGSGCACMRWCGRPGALVQQRGGLGAGVQKRGWPRGAAWLHSGQHVCAMRSSALGTRAASALTAPAVRAGGHPRAEHYVVLLLAPPGRHCWRLVLLVRLRRNLNPRQHLFLFVNSAVVFASAVMPFMCMDVSYMDVSDVSVLRVPCCVGMITVCAFDELLVHVPLFCVRGWPEELPQACMSSCQCVAA